MGKYRFFGARVRGFDLSSSILMVIVTLCFILVTEGQQLRYAGNGVGYEDVFIKGDPGELKVSFLMILRLDVRCNPF